MQLRNLNILIYADTPALQEPAAALRNDPRMSRCTVDIRTGGIGEAATWLKSHASPDVLVVGDAADDTILGRLDLLAQTVEPGCKVIVVGRRDSIGIYRQLLAQGIADYLGGNVRATDLIEALTRLYAVGQNLPKGKVIATLSATGGAGGSTIAAFLAASLNDRLGETILLDLDLAMGTAGLMMGVDIRDAVAGALANPGFDAALVERTLARDKGARVLSTSGALRDAVHLNADAAERLTDVARTMSKALVIDLPKGWGDTHERVLAMADEVVLVTLPDLTGLRNARMILDHLASLRVDGASPKLILNKCGFARTREYRGDELREALGVRPAAFIPWDPDPLVEAMANGRPVTGARGKAASAMRAFGATILAGPERKNTATANAFFPSLKTLFAKPA